MVTKGKNEKIKSQKACKRVCVMKWPLYTERLSRQAIKQKGEVNSSRTIARWLKGENYATVRYFRLNRPRPLLHVHLM